MDRTKVIVGSTGCLISAITKELDHDTIPVFLNSWEHFAEILGLPDSKRTELREKLASSTFTVYQVLETILLEWKMTKGEDASIKSLTEALENSNMEDFAEVLETRFVSRRRRPRYLSDSEVETPLLKAADGKREINDVPSRRCQSESNIRHNRDDHKVYPETFSYDKFKDIHVAGENLMRWRLLKTIFVWSIVMALVVSILFFLWTLSLYVGLSVLQRPSIENTSMGESIFNSLLVPTPTTMNQLVNPILTTAKPEDIPYALMYQQQRCFQLKAKTSNEYRSQLLKGPSQENLCVHINFTSTDDWIGDEQILSSANIKELTMSGNISIEGLLRLLPLLQSAEEITFQNFVNDEYCSSKIQHEISSSSTMTKYNLENLKELEVMNSTLIEVDVHEIQAIMKNTRYSIHKIRFISTKAERALFEGFSYVFPKVVEIQEENENPLFTTSIVGESFHMFFPQLKTLQFRNVFISWFQFSNILTIKTLEDLEFCLEVPTDKAVSLKSMRRNLSELKNLVIVLDFKNPNACHVEGFEPSNKVLKARISGRYCMVKYKR